MRLSVQFGVLLLVMLAVAVGVTGGSAFVTSRDSILSGAKSHMQTLADTKKTALEKLLFAYTTQVQLISSSTGLRKLLLLMQSAGSEQHAERVREILLDALPDNGPCRAIEVRDPDGKLVISTRSRGDAIPIEDRKRFGAPYPPSASVLGLAFIEGSHYCIVVSSPISQGDSVLGHALVTMPHDRLARLFGVSLSAYETGEALLARRDANGDAVFLHPVLRRPGQAPFERVPANQMNVPIHHALKGKEGILASGEFVDYSGEPVVAAIRHVDVLDWGLVVKVDREELLAPVRRLSDQLLGSSLVLMLVFAIIGALATRSISSNLHILEYSVIRVAGGDLESRVAETGPKEIQAVAKAFNHMVKRLESTRAELLAKTASLERALREEEKRESLIAGLADSVPLGIYVKDKGRRYMLVNHTLTKWYALPRQEIIGHTAEEIYDKPPPEKMESLWARVMDGETVSYDGDLTYPDGETRTVEAIYAPYRTEGGGIEGFFCVVTDVTQARARERQLRHTQKMEAIGQLIGGVAHDFNNLLTTIIGNLDLLRRSGRLSDKEVRRTTSAIEAARRGSALTSKLLGTSRMDDLKPEAFNILAFLEEVQSLFKRTLREDIELAMHCGDNLPLVYADRQELEVALLNLVVNASDAMPEGGLLQLEAKAVTLGEGKRSFALDLQSGVYVAITVSDTGIGIPKDQIERVFDPFYTTKPKGAGTGLGLSTVYSFARESHGGLTIYSEEGLGTSVQIYLPSSEMFTGGDSSTTAVRAAAETPALVGGDETVLVVEDEDGVRELAVAALEDLGYAVLAACDGPSALQILEKRDDVMMMVSDVIMPGGLSGPELAAVVRKQFPQIRVLFVSGYAEDHLERSGRITGDIKLLHKPYDQAELANAVRWILDDT